MASLTKTKREVTGINEHESGDARLVAADIVTILLGVIVIIAMTSWPWLRLQDAAGANIDLALLEMPPTVGGQVGLLLLQVLLVSSLLVLAAGGGAIFVTLWGVFRSNMRHRVSWLVFGMGMLGLLHYGIFAFVSANPLGAGVLDQDLALVAGTGYWIAFIATLGLLLQVVMPRPEYPADAPLLEQRPSPGRVALYVALAATAFVALIPFYWMLSNSLMTLGETLNRSWMPVVPQFENYSEAWENASFSDYFMNSVIITIVTIVSLLFTSILAGYAFARIRFFGREVLFVILLSTLMIPESVTMIPNFLMVAGQIIPWPFGSMINTLPALTLPFAASAFAIFLLRQFFAQIPDDLWDAARIDGSGHLRFLVQICLPISRPAILTVTLLTFIATWNAFLWPLIVTTRPDWRPLMVGLYNFVTEAGPETHLLMAGATITIVPMLILYFLTQKSFTEGIATTGLKG
jgi:ABC-type glycerol-3-phosphate transport system permease component